MATVATSQPPACFDENRRADSNWQVNKTLAQCNQKLFETKDAADVTFSIEYENGPSKTNPVKIRAHKLILLSRSPVFHAMFCGDIPFTDPEIRVTDVDPGAFQEVLRYMYTDAVNITPSNVLYITYATKKYILPALTDLCVRYLEQDLGPENVCLILEHSLFFGEDDLIRKALRVVQANTVEVLETSAFSSLSPRALGRILDLERVSADEVDIFAACMDWASAECKRRDMEDSPENQRTILGDFLFKIRFPAMTVRQFADIVVPAGILTDHEGFLMFQSFVCEMKPDLGKFQTKPRSPGKLVIAGPYMGRSVTVGYQKAVDLLCIVNRDIQLISLLVHDFVRSNGNDYSKFDVRLTQEHGEIRNYTTAEEETETLTVDGHVVTRLPMFDVAVKTGRLKFHIDHWVCRRKSGSSGSSSSSSSSSSSGSKDASHVIHYGESERAFVTSDKVVTMKFGPQKDIPLYGLEYWLA